MEKLPFAIVSKREFSCFTGTGAAFFAFFTNLKAAWRKDEETGGRMTA